MSDIKIGSREGFTVVANDLHVSGNVTADGSGLGSSSETVNLTTQATTSSVSPAGGTAELFSSGSKGVRTNIMTSMGSVLPLNSELLYAQSEIYADPGLSTSMNATGFLSDINFVDTLSFSQASAHLTQWTQATAASNGSIAYTETDDEFVWDIEGRPWVFGKIQSFVPTDIRMFVGLTNEPGGNVLGQDNPNPQHVGLSFSTDRPDTNWQFTASGSSGQSRVDTGSPPGVTTPWYFLIDVESPAECRITLFDDEGTEVASHIFGDGNLPSTGQPLYFTAGCEARAAATKYFSHFFYKLRARGRTP